MFLSKLKHKNTHTHKHTNSKCKPTQTCSITPTDWFAANLCEGSCRPTTSNRLLPCRRRSPPTSPLPRRCAIIVWRQNEPANRTSREHGARANPRQPSQAVSEFAKQPKRYANNSKRKRSARSNTSTTP